MSQAGHRTKSGPGWLAALGGPLLIVTALAMIIGLVSPADDDGERTAGWSGDASCTGSSRRSRLARLVAGLLGPRRISGFSNGVG